MDKNLYMRSVTCPMCGNAFKTTKVRHDSIRHEKRDSDMCDYFKGANPYFYEINVCPKCGFSFSDNFKQTMNPSQINKFTKMVTNQWKGQDYCGERSVEQAIEAFKLALLSGQIIDMKDSLIGGICLRICWLYRYSGNTVEEKRFMKGAVDFYEKAYEVEDENREKTISPEIMLYLLGELNYRLGNIEESGKWFGIALSKCNSGLVKQQTINMIRDRWMDIKSEFKKQ